MSLMAWIFFRVRAASPRARPGRRARDPRAESLLVPGSLLPRRGAAAQGPLHGQVAALQAADAVRSTRTAASSRCAAASPTRRRSSPRSRCSTAATRWPCTPRAAAPAPASSSEKPRRGIGRLALQSGAPIVPVAIVGSSPRAQLEAPAVPEDHASTTASRSPTNASRRRRATRSRPPPTPSSRRCARSTTRRPRPGSATGLRLGRARLAGDEQGEQRADGQHRRADPRRARHAVGEGLRRGVGAVGGEHRGEHGDAERAADLADRVRRAGGLAGLLGRTAASTALAVGANTSAMPVPAEDERDDERAVGDVGRRDRREPARSRSPAAPARRPSAGASRCGR